MRKKLFAVIMSAMMMITFMPSMAFAATENVVITAHQWFNNYAKADVTYTINGVTQPTKTVPATRVFDPSTGKVTSTVTVYGNVDGSAVETKEYYDMSYASIVDNQFGNPTAAIPADTYLSNISGDYVNGNPLGIFVKFVKPAYATATTDTPVYKLISTLDSDFTVQVKKAENYKAYTEGEYVFPIKVTAAAATLVGEMASQKAKITTNYDAFDFGNLSFNVEDSTVPYKGSFAFQCVTPGITAQYMVMQSAGEWIPTEEQRYVATAPTVKGQGAYVIKVKVSNAFGKTKELPTPCTFTVGQADVNVLFAEDKFDVAKGQKLVPSKLLIASGDGVAAEDLDMFKKFVDKYVTFTCDLTLDTEKQISMTNNYDLAKATDEEKAFVANYGLDVTDTALATLVNAKSKVNTWVKITSAKKTFKAKKGKLAKNKTFTIKDKTRFGKLSFEKVSGNKKITVSEAGKVTAKKGLKKGTYKVTVVEEIPETLNDGILWSDVYKVRTFTIKVK